MFEVRQTLKPGDAGTRKLAARFGDRLVLGLGNRIVSGGPTRASA